MTKIRAIYRTVILVLLLILCGSAIVSSSPLYGGNQPSVAKEFNPKQVQLSAGTAECVRTAWIGDINNRTLICVEWRMLKGAK
jgi:O-acetylhomoserine/O-acetylserine sulfhydrylase-like pyridoxal-dependent enzyme